MVDFGYFPSESVCTGIHLSETFISDKVIIVFSYSSGTCNSFTSNIHVSQTSGELVTLIIESQTQLRSSLVLQLIPTPCKAIFIGLGTCTTVFCVCYNVCLLSFHKAS